MITKGNMAIVISVIAVMVSVTVSLLLHFMK
jgi:hypothetical protein